jgi:cell division protein FtsW
MTTVNVIRKRAGIPASLKFQFDYWLLLAVAALLVIGMLMVYSTTFYYGLRFQNESQLLYSAPTAGLLIGLAAIVVIMQFDYHTLRRISVPFLG